MGKTTHGYSKTRLYAIWIGMKKRCYTPTSTGYENYGARGIRVCDEWLHNFLVFQKWMYDNGYIETAKRGEYTLDRINTDGNYSPENCRIITQKEQCSNRRNNVKVSINGVTHTIKQWSEITNISKTTLYQRYYRGIKGKEFIKESN